MLDIYLSFNLKFGRSNVFYGLANSSRSPYATEPDVVSTVTTRTVVSSAHNIITRSKAPDVIVGSHVIWVQNMPISHVREGGPYYGFNRSLSVPGRMYALKRRGTSTFEFNETAAPFSMAHGYNSRLTPAKWAYIRTSNMPTMDYAVRIWLVRLKLFHVPGALNDVSVL